MASSSYMQPSTMEGDVIPVIDMGPYYEGSEEGKQRVAEELRHAGEKVGFFIITNHGVPLDFQQRVLKSARDYFDQPEEEKMKVPMTPDYPYGYACMGSEILSRSRETKGVPDTKETFQICIGPEENPHPDMMEPRWPDKPEDFQPTMTEYYRVMEKLGVDLMRVAALALDLPEHYFDESLEKHFCALRVLNYPEQLEEPLPGQLRASAHTDYGSLTILMQDDVGGLQVLKKDDTWVDVHSPPGAYVINVGDCFQRWTNDCWKSTMHRVTNSSKARRQSIAFFQNLNKDTPLECLPSCTGPERPPKYATITAGEHLMLKHEAAMGRGAPVEDERKT